MSARSGWVIDFSGLPSPMLSGAAVRVLVELALEVERLLAAQHPADDLDVLAGAGQRLVGRPAVPALDDLRARHAEAEHAAGRWRGGRASWRAIAVAVGVRAAICTTPVPSLIVDGVAGDPGQRGERVGAPRLGGPHRVEAEPLGLLGRRDDVGRRQLPPVPPHQSELHGRSR